MPIPQPNKRENKQEFVIRCMGDDTMIKEFPKQDQRLAVCSSTYEENLSKHEDNGKTIRKH